MGVLSKFKKLFASKKDIFAKAKETDAQETSEEKQESDIEIKKGALLDFINNDHLGCFSSNDLKSN